MALDAATALATPEEKATHAELIEGATTVMDRQRQPGGFVRDLFGRVPPEDLSLYSPDAIGALALSARRHFAVARQPGDPAIIRLEDVTLEMEGRDRDLTILDVVNDNRPFLLDSTLAALSSFGLNPLLVAHPILATERERSGELRRVVGETTADTHSHLPRESFIHIHLGRLDDEDLRNRLIEELRRVYADVSVVSDDQAAMRDILDRLIADVGREHASLRAREAKEARAFLQWLRDGHFTLLGMRGHMLDGCAETDLGSATLGLLRDPNVEVLRVGQSLVDVTPEIAAFMKEPLALIVTKASTRSRVHRATHLDYIAVKHFAEDGTLTGELRIVGLFDPSAYASSVRDVPYLRRKVEEVVARTGFDPTSHAGRTLIDVLETYPRDDLFQIEVGRLHRFALAIMNLAERPRIRVLSRIDHFGRFVSLLVYVPKDRYDTNVRAGIGAFLAQAFGGRLSVAYPDFPEGPLARIHYIVGFYEKSTRERDPAALEAGVSAIVRTWSDGLRDALAQAHTGEAGRVLARRFANAFSDSYRENFAPEIAVADIAILDRLSESAPRAVDLVRRDGDRDSQVRLKVFSRGSSLSLSERVPGLENLGFRVGNERTYRIALPGADTTVWLHDMLLERATGAPIDVPAVEKPLETALLALSDGLAESDGYNRLVMEAGLDWREAALLRGLGRYLRQLRIRYGQDYLALTLSRHGTIAARIVALFLARFDPALQGDRAAAQAEIRSAIEDDLSAVTSLDDDRILRRFVNLVEAAVRTNYFQSAPSPTARGTIAFKFACADVAEMPLPRPLFEIFVYSPRVEGVHLRFGYVARGGLRWSDRPEDFRTEILGLVKAQQVKNAVIVPVGAKGGFYPKRLPSPSDRQAWIAEGTQSYRIFIRNLLSLTDNIVEDRIVPPADTVRHDPDDSYLVVAADKGTATFSDIANGISETQHHWLGDAFASGGSQGYDHKAMGITARGAWEAVKRHFREIDVDVQTDPITVVGVGDMSGDVFGNGMLLSTSLKLVAAFDHRDIFLDPNPDPAASHAERARLFALPRSSWADYDRARISPGGGIFSRSVKAIALSPEIRAVLGFDAATATPAELIQAILKAPVDLLWLGGIGTYVRAASETDDEAGDRANDGVRVTGASLRVKVVGEGANLGLTQLGRIEAARAGIRLNTDAIDNSAGVNTSDVEVNIKIALMSAQRDGRLDVDARNALLVEMTDDVAALVLRNNQLQTLALSLAVRRGAVEAGFAMRVMQALEGAGRLDRAVEYLPDDAGLTERLRRGDGLTRPEYAVLLAYAKLALYDAILDSPVPDDPYFDRELQRYFPQALKQRFPDTVKSHRLRREIIATALANILVNRGGPTLPTRLIEETGADAFTIAKAYALTRDAYGLMELNLAIDSLDNKIPGEDQLALYAEVQDLLTSRIVWFIRNLDLTTGLAPIVARYREGISAVEEALPRVLDAEASSAIAARRDALVSRGMAPAPAKRLAGLVALVSAPDIVRIAETEGHDLTQIAATHFAIEQTFRLDDLTAASRKVPANDTFDRVALERVAAQIAVAHRGLTAEVLGNGGSGPDAVAAWASARGQTLSRIREEVDAIAASDLTVSKAVVAANLLSDLVRKR